MSRHHMTAAGPVPFTPEEEAQRDAEEAQALIDQQQDDIKSKRQERNALLALSDWTQLNDSPVNRATWAIYRQALRDLPQQAGFPHVIDWPVAPNGSTNL